MKSFRCVHRRVVAGPARSWSSYFEEGRRFAEALFERVARVQCPMCCCMCFGRDEDGAVETFARHLERDH